VIPDTRKHDPANCDCDRCFPASVPVAGPDPCACVEDGFRASLERWKDACSCCFSEAYPGGVEEALQKARL